MGWGWGANGGLIDEIATRKSHPPPNLPLEGGGVDAYGIHAISVFPFTRKIAIYGGKYRNHIVVLASIISAAEFPDGLPVSVAVKTRRTHGYS